MKGEFGDRTGDKVEVVYMKLVNDEAVAELKKSGVLDEQWYLDRYPDVRMLGMDAAEHYLWIGEKLGRSLSASVHSSSDAIARAVISAGNRQLDTDNVISGKAASTKIYKHKSSNSVPQEISIKFDEGLFDNDDYITKYSDIAQSKLTPFEHYRRFGFKEGRTGRFFDDKWYEDNYKDIRSAKINGFEHYLKFGKKEARIARFILLSTFTEKSPNQQVYENFWTNMDSNPADLNAYKIFSLTFSLKPKISIIMPVYKSNLKYLRKAIDSALSQTYSNLELCIADDCSGDNKITELLEQYRRKDKRLKYVVRDKNGHISAASNSALELVTGEFVGLLDHDDMLHPNALFWVVEALNKNSTADLIFTDEDKIDEHGYRSDPHFKSDFNYELFLTQNMISHFGVYRTSVMKECGGFRLGFEGAQDFDLSLRFVERGAQNIVHIPRVLYHWRAIEGSTAISASEKTYSESASIRALKEHVIRVGKPADVSVAPEIPQYFRVKFHLIANPKISIIIPTKDRVDLLKQCIGSIFEKSTYKNYEVIVVSNNSVEVASHKYFRNIETKGIKVVYDDLPFNYPRVNNFGFLSSEGEHVCLMNNDIEIITPNWMEEMLSHSQYADVGCVGARLWYPDDTLQHGGVIVGLGGVAGHSHKYLPKNSAGYFGRAMLPQAFSAVTAACLMVKASIYRTVSGLDEGLSVAFNDVDFCLRVREAGFRNVWTPYAEMFHHESASRGVEDTPEKRLRFAREVEFMKDRWGSKLLEDPFYNPNLSLGSEDFSFAPQPRLTTIHDMR